MEILIAYVSFSTVISWLIFLLAVTDEYNFIYYGCPKYIYDHSKFNKFGTFLTFLVFFVMIPVYYLLWLVYWLCHVGRK